MPAPTPGRLLRRWGAVTAIAAVITQAGIAVTGSVVRVTGSGLGCPTWPQCFPGSMVPVPHDDVSALTQWVEFGNRLLTFVVGFVALACWILTLLIQPRRRRLRVLTATLPVGVGVQAVVGGVTVLTGLAWWTVALHFLLSMVLVWVAVLVVAGFAEGDAAPRWHIPPALRGLLRTAVVLMALLLVAGTFVTAAGPHAGDAATPRLMIDIPTLATGHSNLFFALLGVVAGLGFALRAMGAPARTWTRYGVLLAVLLGQGALGIVQYATGVPEALVSLHVLGAALTVIAMASLWTALRDRDPLIEDAPAPTAADDRPLAGTPR